VKVAQQFNGTDAVKYKAACNELRLPYWDWNAQAGMPDVTQQSFITVVKPLTGLTRISNPFYNYRYPASQVADYVSMVHLDPTQQLVGPEVSGPTNPIQYRPHCIFC
jgi:hypothetical protein